MDPLEKLKNIASSYYLVHWSSGKQEAYIVWFFHCWNTKFTLQRTLHIGTTPPPCRHVVVLHDGCVSFARMKDFFENASTTE
jgi:hypothetical protein